MLLISSLLALIGQLAVIRLTVGSAVSVGEAIGHAARRMPIYFISGLIIALVCVLLVIPFALVAFAAGAPLGSSNEQAILQSPAVMILSIFYLALVCFVGVRMLLASPVASEENVGPIGIIQRSWELTAGHWWRLFGFLMLFVIGAGIAMAAIGWGVALVAVLLFGPIAPMSLSALVLAIVNSVVNAAITVLLAVILARIYVQLAGPGSTASVPSSGT